MKGISRVILAQDVASRNTEITGAAVELAAKLGVELVGLFLEDLNLFRLMELPVSRQVSPFGRPSSRQSLEGELRALSEQVQTNLAALAQRRGVQWSFRVVRGEPAKELAALGLAEDLWVMAATSRMMGLEVQWLSSLHKALQDSSPSMLFLSGNTTIHHPLVVLGSKDPEKVLEAAFSLLNGTHLLTVLLVAEPSVEASLQSWQAQHKVTVRPIYTEGIRLEQIAKLRVLTECDGLVIGADMPLLTGDGLEQLLALTRSPVLVVR